MKTICLSIILITLSFSLSAQNLLGYKEDKIEKYIEKNNKDLVKDTETRNEKYDYLKYTDGFSGTTTVYFFLDANGRCKRIKKMYVHSIKDEIIEELDRNYTPDGDNKWTDIKKGSKAIISLNNEEWFFTVTIEPESK